jgi:hypothetical protein
MHEQNEEESADPFVSHMEEVTVKITEIIRILHEMRLL